MPNSYNFQVNIGLTEEDLEDLAACLEPDDVIILLDSVMNREKVKDFTGYVKAKEYILEVSAHKIYKN